jgi:hypothetical protein
MINYKEQFISKHGQPDNGTALDEYINFLTSYSEDTDIEYSELHHILPTCKFKEYSKDPNNLVRLLYKDHVHAHLLLFTAYNIRAYQRPLNWMMTPFKDKEMISNAAKRGWISLKENEETYTLWKKSRSECMKSLSSEEQRRRANIFWDNITEERYLEFCKTMTNIWTDDKKHIQSKKLKMFYEIPLNRELKSIESRQRYESQSKEERDSFKEKMNHVNKQQDKRDKAGKSIKKLWEDDSFREKMKQRKVRSGTPIKLIFSDNTFREFDSISSLSREYRITIHTIRKYIDSDKHIELNENKVFIKLIK